MELPADFPSLGRGSVIENMETKAKLSTLARRLEEL